MNINMIYKIKKIIYKIIRKDSMQLNIEYYRKLGVKIGDDVRIFSSVVSSEPYLINIGNYVTISTGVEFITHDNSISKIIKSKTDLFGEIKIGDNCFIGANTIILPGVTLGDNVIVGAGSVVTKSYEKGNVIIAGNPAKIISNNENYKEKIKGIALNTLNMNFYDKKMYVMQNKNKFLKR